MAKHDTNENKHHHAKNANNLKMLLFFLRLAKIGRLESSNSVKQTYCCGAALAHKKTYMSAR
jgi:hypothetical protein